MNIQEPIAYVFKATTKKGETAHFGEYLAAKAWAGWGSVERIPLKKLTLIEKPCGTCEALARTVMMDQTAHDIAPPAAQRQWVGLTDDEMQALWDRYAHMEMMRAIEAKLKELNT
jgi:hypothetical protein